jgi:hypothetical protein
MRQAPAKEKERTKKALVKVGDEISALKSAEALDEIKDIRPALLAAERASDRDLW